MELNQSRKIVKTLAQGVHPSTGEVFPPDSPYNDPEVIRALFFILDVGNSAKRPKKSTEERRQNNLELGRPRNAGLPWAEDDRAMVKSRFLAGTTIEKLAEELERSSAAIVAEIIRQDLVPPSLR